MIQRAKTPRSQSSFCLPTRLTVFPVNFREIGNITLWTGEQFIKLLLNFERLEFWLLVVKFKVSAPAVRQ